MPDSANSDTNRFPRLAFYYRARKKESPTQCGKQTPVGQMHKGKSVFTQNVMAIKIIKIQL